MLDPCDLVNFLFDDASELCGVGLVDRVAELVAGPCVLGNFLFVDASESLMLDWLI